MDLASCTVIFIFKALRISLFLLFSCHLLMKTRSICVSNEYNCQNNVAVQAIRAVLWNKVYTCWVHMGKGRKEFRTLVTGRSSIIRSWQCKYMVMKKKKKIYYPLNKNLSETWMKNLSLLVLRKSQCEISADGWGLKGVKVFSICCTAILMKLQQTNWYFICILQGRKIKRKFKKPSFTKITIPSI